MNLGKNVYNLLKRQSEVYIKGLGSFKRNHTPATFDERRGVYLPPISYIDFEQTSNSGYDFIQYFAQLHALDKKDAEQQIDDIVRELLQKIGEEGQAKLDDLGYLVSYGEGYVFKALDLSGFHYEPVAVGTSGPVNAGITTVNPEPTQPQSEETQVSDLPKPPVTVSEEAPVSAEIMEPFFEHKKLSDPRSTSNTVWYILIAVVALSIIGGLVYYGRKQPVRTQPIVTIDSADKTQDTLVASVPQDSLPNAQDSLAASLADTAALPKQEVTVVTTPSKRDRWQIVIGSHKTLEQAYEHAASYNKKGFAHVRVIPSNLAKNRKKVIWDSYETKAQLDSALQYVQKNIMKDAWPDKIN